MSAYQDNMQEFELEPGSGHTIYLTPDGYKSLQAELEDLTLRKRAEIAERIRESQEHGEFSEDNNELDEVKFEQALIESRISELKTIFGTAQMIDPEKIPTDHIGFGSYVKVKDVDRGGEFEVRVVSSIEADPDRDLVSNEAPMGVALFGKQVGDIAEFEAPIGKIRYRVIQIRR